MILVQIQDQVHVLIQVQVQIKVQFKVQVKVLVKVEVKYSNNDIKTVLTDGYLQSDVGEPYLLDVRASCGKLGC